VVPLIKFKLYLWFVVLYCPSIFCTNLYFFTTFFHFAISKFLTWANILLHWFLKGSNLQHIIHLLIKIQLQVIDKIAYTLSMKINLEIAHGDILIFQIFIKLIINFNYSQVCYVITNEKKKSIVISLDKRKR